MSVINTQTTKPAAAIVVLAWHKALSKAVIHSLLAVETVANKCKALVTETYGMVPPTFAQYKADLAAFKAISEAGKVSQQNLERAYRTAIKDLFGEQLKADTGSELPVSMAPDAVLKRAERSAKEAKIAEGLKLIEKQAQNTPVGAPKGETQERQPSEAEQVESFVARVGVYECLYACIRIMAADKATEAQAVHMRKMVDAARKAQDAADKMARTAAITPTVPSTVSPYADFAAQAAG